MVNKMSKHKIFVSDDCSPLINSSTSEEGSQNQKETTPVLVSFPKHGQTKNNIMTDETPKKSTKKSKPDSAADGGDSDSDSMEVPGFFSISNQKLPYTKEEDELILKYVLKGQNIFKVSSILLWKHLEAKKEKPKRTFQSLKNRFLRNIKPCLFSKYGYLIKDSETKEKILSKFPELKQQVGRRETLSRLKLPERKPQSKTAEEDGVSSTSADESQMNGESTSPSPNPYRADISNPAVYPEPTQSQKRFDVETESIVSDLFKAVIYERKVQSKKDGVIVCVDFKAKKLMENSFSKTSPGIFARFQKLQEKNKLVLCPTCGRFNLPKEVSPERSSEETDDVVPNSVETPKTVSSNSKRTSLASKLNTETSSRRRRNFTPESSVHSPTSPSLLDNIRESRRINKPEEEIQEIAQVAEVSNSQTFYTANNQVAQSSNSPSPRKKAKKTESHKKVTRTTKGISKSKTNKNGKSVRAKRLRDSDADFDSICEDAMKNFRKLVDYEEEKQLVRKCLNQNFKSIGLEACSEMNLDSYFLESSSDKEGTPPLTIDFDAGNNEKEEQSGGTTASSPSRNLRNKTNKKF